METVRTLFIRRRFQSHDDLWVFMGMDFRGLWTRKINVALRDLSSLSTLEDFGVRRVAASALGCYWAWSAKGCRDPAT